MSSSAEPAAVPSALDNYDGVAIDELARRCGVPAVHAVAETASTMDLAHAAAARGAPALSTFVAEVQTAGRGRNGRRWQSAAGAGVWATVLTRPAGPGETAVLSLRVGLALAAALDDIGSGARAPVALKWPNDLLLGGRKLAGILAEARWREGAPEWVAVGVGVNRLPPDDVPDAVGLGPAVSRAAILAAITGAVRTAASRSGELDTDELAEYAARDAVRGRTTVRPVAGVVVGVAASGALLVRDAAGGVRAVPTASVEYA